MENEVRRRLSLAKARLAHMEQSGALDPIERFSLRVQIAVYLSLLEEK